jgi:hypothetical protein
MRPLKLTTQQVKEKAARDIKARTNARLTTLIKEDAAERRIQYRRDQEQEEKAARDIKARHNARLTALIKEEAVERRLQYRRDQEQEDNQQPRDQEQDNQQPRDQEQDNQQPRKSWNTCLNVSCFCLLLVTANALFIQYLLTRKL